MQSLGVAALLVLLHSSPALAETGAPTTSALSGVVGVAPGVCTYVEGGSMGLGGAVFLGANFRAAPGIGIELTLRGLSYPAAGAFWGVALGLRSWFRIAGADASAQFIVGPSIGYAVWPGLARGDVGGALGPLFGLALAAKVPIRSASRLIAGVETQVETGVFSHYTLVFPALILAFEWDAPR